MRELELTIAVGETLRLGEYLLTIMECEGSQVCVMLEDVEEAAFALSASPPPGK